MSQWGQPSITSAASVSMLGKTSPELVYGHAYAPAADEVISNINVYAANATASDRYCQVAIYDITNGRPTATQIWTGSIKVPANTTTPTWLSSTGGYYGGNIPNALQQGKTYSYEIVGDSNADWTLYYQSTAGIGETLTTVTNNTQPSTWGSSVAASNIDPCFYITTASASHSVTFVNPGVGGVNNHVQLGSTGNNAYTLNMLAATSCHLGSALVAFTGSNNAYTFTAPSIADGAAIPYPTGTLSFTDGSGRLANSGAITVTLPNSLVSTLITAAAPTLVSNGLKYTVPSGLATGDYIVYNPNPSATTVTKVNADGTIITNFNGTQTMYRYNSVAGTFNAFTVVGLNVGSGGYVVANTTVTSSGTQISGLSAGNLAITATGGLQYAVSTDGVTYNTFVSSGGTIQNGNWIKVTLTAGATAGNVTTGTLTIDSATAVFSVTVIPASRTATPTLTVNPATNKYQSGYTTGTFKTISGSGFGNRVNGKKLFVMLGGSLSTDPLTSRLQGNFCDPSAFTGTIGGSSAAAVDLAQGSAHVALFTNGGIPFDGTKPLYSYSERYYNWDPRDGTQCDNPFDTTNVNSLAINLKCNRFWSAGSTHDLYVGGCGYNCQTLINGGWTTAKGRPANGTVGSYLDGYFDVENVSGNANGNYFTNSTTPYTWISDEFLMTPNSAIGVRDAIFRQYRNGVFLNTATLNWTPRDINFPDPLCFAVMDEVSNNTRGDIQFNTYYRYTTYDDEHLQLYYGNAATLAACTGPLIPQPTVSWVDNKIVYREVNNLGYGYWYIRTGTDTWYSTNGGIVQ